MNDKHFNDEQLIAAYYAEDSAPEAREHLQQCAECSARLQELKGVLDAVTPPQAPERPYGFELRMWNAVEPRIAPAVKKQAFSWRVWTLAASAAALVIVAFLVGRYSSVPGNQPAPPSAAIEQRREVLQVALADHLEDSQRLLVELNHAQDTGVVKDASKRAEDLLESNRIYRQAAQRNGDKNVAQVLDQLERVLTEVAHDDEASPAAQQQVATQAQDSGLLFKLRVMSNAVKRAPKQDRANSNAKGQQI